LIDSQIRDRYYDWALRDRFLLQLLRPLHRIQSF
jgi:hypothetical protein